MCMIGFCRQLQQQQAELEAHQRDGLTAYDLSQVACALGALEPVHYSL